MARFAQIDGTRVHWIFTADQEFPHAPYVKIIDITNVVPAPQEGWTFNPQDGTFTPPPTPLPVPPSTLKAALASLIADPTFATLTPKLRTVLSEWNNLVP